MMPLFIIKFREDKWQSIKKIIEEIHSHQTPGIISIPHQIRPYDYLHWTDETLGEK